MYCFINPLSHKSQIFSKSWKISINEKNNVLNRSEINVLFLFFHNNSYHKLCRADAEKFSLYGGNGFIIHESFLDYSVVTDLQAVTVS